VHCKTVSNPERLPVDRAVWVVIVLAVHGYHVGLDLADDTPRYELRDGMISNWHHWYWLIGRQPVGFVIPAGVVANVVKVADHERHGFEPTNTGPSHT
jgi:hypothetical protein